MKALKITFALLAVAMLSVSGVQSTNEVADNEPTYKSYNSQDLLAMEKKKFKLESQL